MNCTNCGRPLTRFAVSVDTRDGPVGWGPKCARKVFKVLARRRARIFDARRPPPPDPRQRELFEAAA